MNSHSHCENCFNFNCDYASSPSCKLIDCKQTGCDFRMHQCKQQDHLDVICPGVRVPCINSEYGCNSFMLRGDLRTHLERCPASVVSCSFVNNQRLRSDTCCRWRVESKFKDHFQCQLKADDSSLTSHMKVERVEVANGELNDHQTKPKQVCGSDFRRDEYCSHYQNVHCDIMHSLNGWMEVSELVEVEGDCSATTDFVEVRNLRNVHTISCLQNRLQRLSKFCPNQQYGCMFNTKRIQPKSNDRKTEIVFSKQNEAFGHLVNNDDNEYTKHSVNEDVNLTQLPFEVISLILSYLDAFSLNNISLTNKLLRSLCCNLLERRGVVSIIWKNEIKFNRIKWTVAGYRWKFSNHFSLIGKWEFNDAEFLNHFANDCKHFDKLVHKEPFQLIGIGVKKEKNSFVNC